MWTLHLVLGGKEKGMTYPGWSRESEFCSSKKQKVLRAVEQRARMLSVVAGGETRSSSARERESLI